MQCGIREHRVERLGKIECGGIAQNKREAGKVFAGIGQHVGRAIEPYNLSAAARDFGGELAGAAAHIENSFAGLGVQKFQKIRAVAPHEGMLILIARGVPGRSLKPFFREQQPSWLPWPGGRDRRVDRSSSITVPGGAAAARTSLNSSAFFKSFLDGGACSWR